MADDGLIRLDVDNKPGLAKVNEFEAEFTASLKRLGDAVKGGLDPLSDEAAALADRALDAGKNLANAGEEGAAAFEKLTGATRGEINALQDVTAAAKEAAPELKEVAAAAAEAAQGVVETGTSAEQAVPRINSMRDALKFLGAQAGATNLLLRGVLVVGLLQVASTINKELVGALNTAAKALGAQGDQFRLVAGVLPIYQGGIDAVVGSLVEMEVGSNSPICVIRGDGVGV